MRNKKILMKTVAFSSMVCIGASSLFLMPAKAQQNSSFKGAGNEVKTNAEMKQMEKYVCVMPTYQQNVQEVKLEVPSYRASKQPNYATLNNVLPNMYCSEDIEDSSIAKNQDPFGTCWAHAALASLEDSLIQKNILNPNGVAYTRQNTDFSERHLAYFTYHGVKDPLGGIDGDSLKVEKVSYLDAGGFQFSPYLTLAAWKGAVKESDAPYSEIAEDEYNYQNYDLDEDMGMKHDATLRSCKLVNFKDRDEIKRMIMEYGACSISICYSSSFLNNKLRFCADKNYITNHDVTIVGWDDTDSKSNYPNSPTEDGCWIVRNSWGSNWGHNGYFYVSYDDKTINPDSGAYARFFIGQRGTLFDHNYQYDGSSYLTIGRVEPNGAIANRFTVPDNSKCEQLRAVSFGLDDVNVNYSIQVYKNPTASSPVTGEAQLTTPQTGTIDYAGYYTIHLKQPVLLRAGETFSIVITLTPDDTSKTNVRFFADPQSNTLTYKNSSGEITRQYISTNVMKSGESYRKNNASSKWYDLFTYGTYAPRIKAFTVDYNVRYLGDLNGDGKVNRTDAMGFSSAERTYVNGIQRNQRIYPIRADLDNDGDVDSDDNRLLSQALSSPLQEVNINYGDVNGDGLIDKDDVTDIQNDIAQYGTQGYVNGKVYYKAEADMDQNGALDQCDAQILHERVYGY